MMMTVQRLILAVCISAVLIQTSQAADRKPNVVLFVSDDHGKDDIGCYGNSVIQTPNMDRLALEGVRFTRAYCTSASCAASRSVILTGRFGHATGSYGHVHDYHHFSTIESVESLPVLMEQAGYRTARIGKFHLAPESVYRFNDVLEANQRNPVEMAERCREVIGGDRPFFLYFCTSDPHRDNPFTPRAWDAPNSFGNRPDGYPGVTTIRYKPEEVIVPPFLPDTSECRSELAEYYQSVSRIDQGIGHLRSLLAEAGKSDNTIFIYISDNGMAFPGAKTTVYEPGINLPCLVVDPRTDQAGLVSDCMVSWVDLTPTILDLADIAFDKGRFHGRSFASVLETPEQEVWKEVYASHTFHEITMYYPMRVVIEDRYKLIWNIAWEMEYPFASDLWAASTWQGIHRSGGERYGKRRVADYLRRPEFELYDLHSDPHEVHNLSTDPDQEQTLARLKQKLKLFQRNTHDPWLIMWSHDASLQGRGVDL